MSQRKSGGKSVGEGSLTSILQVKKVMWFGGGLYFSFSFVCLLGWLVCFSSVCWFGFLVGWVFLLVVVWVRFSVLLWVWGFFVCVCL